MAQSRFLTHTIVLLAAALIPFLTTFNRVHVDQAFGANYGASLAGLVHTATAPSQTDSLVMTQRGFIPKLNLVTVDQPPPRGITNYSMKLGDTVANVAAQFGLTVDTLRWSNGLTDLDAVWPGKTLIIPPANGVLVKVQPGMQLPALAAQYHVAVQDIIDFNLLRDPDHLVVGLFLMVPDGQGPPLARPAPGAAVRQAYSTVRESVTYQGSVYGPPNPFPWGQCTWWVAHKRSVPWAGNAWEWWGNARRMGFAEGQTPRVGAIMVQGISYWSGYGHVAYVESVENDGTFTVSEMNYGRWGVVDLRKINSYQGLDLLGFIYN